jgi:hypothetical protein
MRPETAGERRWLRPLALLFFAFALAVGQPTIVIVLTFALLVVLSPGGGMGPLLFAAIGFAVVFAGEPGGGMWYLERGWAILVSGSFAAASWLVPSLPFVKRGMIAVAGGSAAAAMLLLGVGGWPAADWLVLERLQSGLAAAFEVARLVTGEELDQGVVATMERAAHAQGILFPALLALGTLASLGVGWWVYVRMVTSSDEGLGPLRGFRFPDPLVWVLIVGVLLVLVAEWSVGWGRLGSNLVAFMGALYVVRGAGVLLFLTGGVSALGGLAVAVGLVLAAPVLVMGALVVGLGDSWFDLRTRFSRNGEAEGG